jgi:alkylated DNA nucleotide flippase Atl1
MDELLVERVLRAVEHVPPGRVVSYGDLAALVGTGPRQVGAVLRDWGSGVAWWRVTNRDGDLPEELLGPAGVHWAAEGIGVRAGGRGCRFVEHRADLAALAAAYDAAVTDLRAP